MKAKHSTGLCPWLPGLLALSLMACTQIGKAQIAPPITVLHSFNGSDGQVWLLPGAPWSGYSVFGGGLIQGKDGALYGATLAGGTSMFGDGTVYKLTTGGVFTSLHSFTYHLDGWAPTGVIQGRDGALYGTTSAGGMYFGGIGTGTIFKITPSGAFTTLYYFDDGIWPYAGLVQGKEGALYGTTAFGGSGDGGGPGGDGVGTVFKIRPDGSGFTTLYNFTGGADGVNPWAALVQGNDGALYGTDYGNAVDSNNNEYIVGSVFKITDSGALTSLHDFGADDGTWPMGALVQGKDGAFYGTTQMGGASNNGTVFKMTPDGALTTLYSFTGGTDGASPYAGLIRGKDGALYGTAYYGGANNYGTVFRITTSGVLTTLYSFSDDSNAGNADGADPSAPLLQGKDGNLYGVADYGGPSDDGTVFQLTMTPIITRFNPAIGFSGASVTLTGTNFTEATNVQFGNIYVGFKVSSDTSLTLTVPKGAKSSRITVYNPFGKGVSKTAFTVIP